jgi:hypothetical protein
MTVTNFEEKGKPGVFDMVKLRDAIHNYHIGSMLNVPSWSTNDTTMERSNHHNK